MARLSLATRRKISKSLRRYHRTGRLTTGLIRLYQGPHRRTLGPPPFTAPRKKRRTRQKQHIWRERRKQVPRTGWWY